MFTEVEGKYVGDKFGELVSENGLSANLFVKNGHAFKVFNKGTDKADIEKEAAIMIAVNKKKLPSPHTYGIVEADGYYAIEMEYIPGDAMINKIINYATVGNYTALEEEIVRLAQVQFLIHQIEADGFEDYKKYLKDIFATKEELSDSQKEYLMGYLESLPSGNKIVHGDFHPMNIIYRGTDPVVIDWATAGAGIPACDVARTYLNFSYPPVRILQKEEVRMNERYLDAYNAISGIKYEDIVVWFPVAAGLSIGRDPVFSKNMQKYLNIQY